jgi:hypothetical protein
MKKDFYLETLELMIEDYMDENPGVTWEQAHKVIANKVYDVAIARMSEMVDYCRVVMEDC